MRSMTYEHALFRATQKSPHSHSTWKPFRFSFRREPVDFAECPHLDFQSGAKFQRPVRRNAFLFGCLAFSGALKEEHLIVRYGYRCGKTTGVERLHHVVGEERNVSIPTHVHDEIRRHRHSETHAEVVVFHNHPRIGNEGEGLYFIKDILDDLSIPSSRGTKRSAAVRFRPRRLGASSLESRPRALLPRRKQICKTIQSSTIASHSLSNWIGLD